MNIEKLGFTPGPWQVDINDIECRIYKGFEDIGYLCGDSNVNIIAAAPEMLEALIDESKFLEKFLSEKASVIGPGWYNSFYERQVEIKVRIAKACYPKKWEEIKELIK